MLLSSSKDDFLPLCSCTTHKRNKLLSLHLTVICTTSSLQADSSHTDMNPITVVSSVDGVAVVDGVQSWSRKRDMAYNLLGAHTEA